MSSDMTVFRRLFIEILCLVVVNKSFTSYVCILSVVRDDNSCFLLIPGLLAFKRPYNLVIKEL